MKRIGFWVLLLPLLLAGVASAADGDRRERDRSRPRDANDWRDAMRNRMKEATKKFDKDGDGKLNDSERRAMFESFREQMSQRRDRPAPSAERREGSRASARRSARSGDANERRDSARRPAWPPRPSASSDRRGPSRDSASRPAWPPRPQFGQFGQSTRGPWGWGAPHGRGPWGGPMARGPFGGPPRPEASRSDKQDNKSRADKNRGGKRDEAKKRDGGAHARRHHARGERGGQHARGHHRGGDHRRMAWGHGHRERGDRAHGDRPHDRRHGSAEGKRDGDKPSARPERSPSDREERRPERRRGEGRRPRA